MLENNKKVQYTLTAPSNKKKGCLSYNKQPFRFLRCCCSASWFIRKIHRRISHQLVSYGPPKNPIQVY